MGNFGSRDGGIYDATLHKPPQMKDPYPIWWYLTIDSKPTFARVTFATHDYRDGCPRCISTVHIGQDVYIVNGWSTDGTGYIKDENGRFVATITNEDTYSNGVFKRRNLTLSPDLGRID